jgi:hypothetical protein
MKIVVFTLFIFNILFTYSQTEIDGIMMGKGLLCSGLIYENSSWTYYWEGTFKRENLNFGKVSTEKVVFNTNYGITNKLNVIVSLPYVVTNASAGTLKGQKGLQDLSFTLKYMPIEKKIKNVFFSAYVFGGYSFPVSDYLADYLPLSIGLKSKVITGRAMIDLQWKSVFVTTSFAYLKRYDIEIERDAYYTTSMHYTNLVDMPDAVNYNLRLGYRTNWLIAEAIFDDMKTLGKTFDITPNNMPFPSNTMNMSRIGVNCKYTFKKMPELALISGFNHVIAGRNVGQSTTFYGGAFYLIDFNKKTN